MITAASALGSLHEEEEEEGLYVCVCVCLGVL